MTKTHLFWLSQTQLDQIKPYFPLSHGIARVNDRKVISGIIHVLRNGLQWRDAPLDHGPYKTLYTLEPYGNIYSDF